MSTRAISTRDERSITEVVYSARPSFTASIWDARLSFEREANFAVQLITASNHLLDVAQRNKQSVIDAVTNVAAIGVSLNPARKQAYLVPRDGKVCLDIGYVGLLDLATGSGSLKWGQAELVHQHDVFSRDGIDKQPLHKYDPYSKNRGGVIGAYAVVKTADNDYLTTTMSLDELLAIRDRSESWQAFAAKRARSSPWATDEGEMFKKTVIRRGSKTWPRSDRLTNALEFLDKDRSDGFDASATGSGLILPTNDAPQVLEPTEPVATVDSLIKRAERTRTDADALKFWQEHNGSLARVPADHDRFKAAVIAHRRKLAGKERAE